MSFLLSYGFKIDLPNQNIKGKKIPEFRATINNIRINIEAKRMDEDKIMDSIFGDKMTMGIDYTLSISEKDRGLKRIAAQFKNNYENAFNKLTDIATDEYYLIFMLSYYKIGLMGKYTIDFINGLQMSWKGKQLSNFIGVVLPENEKTYLLLNQECDKKALEVLGKILLDQYHSYIPEIVLH